MRTAALLVAALSIPATLLAQDSVPANLARVELARSRNCVAPLSRLEALNRRMAPEAQKFNRLQSLANAVALEDTAIVSTLRPTDPTEAAVRNWFTEDDRLAARIVATGSDSLRQVRQAARDSIKAFLGRSMQTLQTQAQAMADTAHLRDIDAAAAPCTNVIFVRSAVRAACDTIESDLCRVAAADSARPEDPYRFVDSPDALWGMQQFIPWSDPTPLQVGPGGQLVGARTQAGTRQGNVFVNVVVQPLLQPKARLDSVQVAQAQANVDSLGFKFDHPDFVMSPVLSVQMNLTEPLGDETNYVLYLGDLTGPNILWTTGAGGGAPVHAVIPLTLVDLQKMEQGTPLGLAAVKVPTEADAKAEAVYNIDVLSVNEAQAVSALVEYMSGKLSEDLKTLVPPNKG